MNVACCASKCEDSALNFSKLINITTEFLISLYILIVTSDDVTVETNSITDLADRKLVILSTAEINTCDQKENDGRKVRYCTIGQHPIAITLEINME